MEILTANIRGREISTDRSCTQGLNASVRFTNPDSSRLVSSVVYPEMETIPLPLETVIPYEISDFAPEPYRVLDPLKIVIIEKDSQYTASHLQSNIHASGDTWIEAIDNLKSLILDIFEILTSEPEENLAIKAQNQRAILKTYIEHE